MRRCTAVRRRREEEEEEEVFPNICRREFVGVIAGLGGTYIRRTKAWLVDIEQKAYFLTDM